MTHQAMGTPTRKETQINCRKSTDNSLTIELTDAPITFLIPISLVRCSALKAARPKRPRQEIMIAITVNELIMRDMMISFLYNTEISSLGSLDSRAPRKTC